MREIKPYEKVQMAVNQAIPIILYRMSRFLKKLVVLAGIFALLWVAIPAFLQRKPLSAPFIEKSTEKVIPKQFPKEKVDEEVYESMVAAYGKAESYASARLDEWISNVMAKADADFLPWYFGYINMKIRELKSLGYGIGHWFSSLVPSSEEVALEELEYALNSRLIQPETTQLVFENILRETTRVYNDALSDRLSKIQVKYEIPSPEWKKYLTDLSHVIQDSGTSMTSTPVKGAVAVLGAGSLAVSSVGLECLKVLKSGLGKLFSKVTGKTVAKVGAKTAAKAGGKAIGKFAGPIITVAVLVWDIADYKMTESKDKPILRQNINDYLVNVKSALLYDEEFGICSELARIQESLARKI